MYEYRNDDVILHYVRDDIDAKYSREVIEEIVMKTQEVETSIRNIPYNEPVGEPKASLHTFGDGVLVHLYNWNPGHGVMVSFDTDVANRHRNFVDETLTALSPVDETHTFQ